MSNLLSEQLSNFINKDTVIACIGTDKCIADCLGPLVGTLLKERGFKLPVYGTLDKPIHALNIDERLNHIFNVNPDAQIIGIDACITHNNDIGSIKVRDYAIRPGKGVGKELPEVGVASIIGIVDSAVGFEIFSNKSIRLSFVMNMAKQIVEIIFNATRQSKIHLDVGE